MKRFILIFVLSTLPACIHKAPTNKDPVIPPLSTVAPFVVPGISMVDVERKLSGHKPSLMFTYENSGVWEFNERVINPRNNSIHAHRLVVKFDPQGKVSKSTLSECLLPDQESRTKSTSSTLCYRRHLVPFDDQVTYEAIKRLLINSNFQIDHSDATSKIIAATGLQPTKDNDKVMYIKLSINYSSRARDLTELIMAANFNIVEKQMVWVQGGFAGVIIPIPLPFQKTEEWADTGLATPKFYLDFSDALSQLIATEYLVYSRPSPSDDGKKDPTPLVGDGSGSDALKKAGDDAPEESGISNDNGSRPVSDEALFKELQGPIDSAKNIKMFQPHDENTNVMDIGNITEPELAKTEETSIPELEDGVPIDREAPQKQNTKTRKSKSSSHRSMRR